MSLRKCCDICNKEIGKINMGVGNFVFSEVRMFFGIGICNKNYDICDDCYMKFKKLVNGSIETIVKE